MTNSRIEFGKVESTIKFYRSSSGLLFGVCQGVADSFQLNSILVRLLWIASLLFYGFGLGAYLMLAISLPRKDQLDLAFNRRILGVCSKISKKMKWEIGLVRFSALLLSLASFGFAALAYVVLYFSLEEEVITR